MTRTRFRAAVVAAAGLLLFAALPADGAGPDNTTVAAYNDGFIDGQADARGDDNRDGLVDEDESGWDCRTMGNHACGTDIPPECTGAGDVLPLCVTVAARPPYAWTAANGARVDVADGRTEIRNRPEKPGTEGFARVITALDAEWAAAHR
ncbi:hypothetical protein ABT024_05150 [Streptomyces sp. NPDC002812]|uniref:hypothetical protein n=1 Tax=Streptomyces sp. NPDC002812 TaxID=3154434 RepID=UPI00333439B7